MERKLLCYVVMFYLLICAFLSEDTTGRIQCYSVLSFILQPCPSRAPTLCEAPRWYIVIN